MNDKFVPDDTDRFLESFNDMVGLSSFYATGNSDGRNAWNASRSLVGLLGQPVVRNIEVVRFWLVVSWGQGGGNSFLKLVKILRNLTGKSAGDCQTLANIMLASPSNSGEVVVVTSRNRVAWVLKGLDVGPFELTVISQEPVLTINGNLGYLGELVG